MAKDKRARKKAGREQRREQERREQQAQRRRQGLIRLGLFLGVGAVIILILWWQNSGDGDGDPPPEVAATAQAEEGAVPEPPVVPTPPPAGATLTGATPCPPTDGSAERTTGFAERPPDCLEPGATYTAVISTSQGDITVVLDPDTAPGPVNAFVVLSRYGYYDDTAVYRTDPVSGIVQGGAPHTNDASDPGPGFAVPMGDGGFEYAPGQLVLAPEEGQLVLTTLEGAPGLSPEGRLPVLGETDAEGQAVIEAILALHDSSAAGLLGGPPSEPVVIEEIEIEETSTSAS